MIKLDDLAFAAQAHPMEFAVVLFVGLIALGFIATKLGAPL